MEDTKKCPFCAETIKAEAIVCRFCNRELNQGAQTTHAASVDRLRTAPAPTAPQQPAAPPQKNQTGTVVALLIIIVAALGFPSCYSSMNGIDAGSSSTTFEPVVSVPVAPTPVIPARVELNLLKADAVASGEFGIPAIAGVAQNDSGRTINYAEAKAEFYDGSGNIVATGMDNETGIAPGAKWRFNILIPQNINAKKWRVVEVSGD